MIANAGQMTWHEPLRATPAGQLSAATGTLGIPAQRAGFAPRVQFRPSRAGERSYGPLSILGTRVLRTEDPKFLTTGGVYTEDVVDERLAGACHVFFVRSPIAHARITNVDVSAALEAPGVVAAFTGQDLADLPEIPPSAAGLMNVQMKQRLIPTDKVRYVGEVVAAVVTEDPYQGEDAVELVAVDYEPLPAVIGYDPDDSSLLFEDAGTNVAGYWGEASSLQADLFDGCDVVVSHTIINQRVAPAPMETRAAAAVWGDDGRLTTWIPNQGAQGTKASMAGLLGIEPSAIRIITPDVGGAFGAKFGADPEHAIVAWIARQLDRPARWTETRFENLIAMTHGRAQQHTITIGGSRDGDVQAYRLEIVQDAGAYPKIGAVLPMLTILMTTGPYQIPKAEAIAKVVVTNTTPIGAYRGAGRPEATAAIERAIDLFAAEIGADPADVRRKNLLAPFTEPHRTKFGALYDTGDYVKALDKALDAAGYAELRAEQSQRRASGDIRQLGIGLASYVEITGMGDGEGTPPEENATVEVHPDGTATILTGTSPHGQGHATAWAMLASEELGIPVDKITLKWGDTDLIPEGGGTGGSRSLQQGGAAVQQAAQELLEVARLRAAAQLEASASDLVFDKSRSAFNVAGDPDASVPLTQLAENERLLIRTVFTQPGATFPFGTHVAVVEVDTETGKVTLCRVITVDDAGTILNPLLAEGQRHGGIGQGAAQAFLEEVVYDADGNPLTASFADYPFLSATEVPSFELAEMATPTTYNPLGAKGIGEAGSIGSTPAVQNAVVDAVAHLGVRHIDMPTSSRRVWQALQAAQSGSEHS
jgi:carbon-monoxide dehydrogenase large subunit